MRARTDLRRASRTAIVLGALIPLLVGGPASAGAPDRGDIVLTQSTDPATILPLFMVQCTSDPVDFTYANGLARSFQIAGPIAVDCVEFGIELNTGGDWPVHVNLYAGDINGPFEDLDLLGSSEPVLVPDGLAESLLLAPFSTPVLVPAGTSLVVELRTEDRDPIVGGDGGLLFFGGNDAGETAPSYIRAASCGVPDFVTFAEIGAGDVNVVMRVFAAPFGADPCPSDIDGNGAVDTVDLLALLAAWGPCPPPCPPSCPGDLDSDCSVGVTDLLQLLAAWGPCPIAIQIDDVIPAFGQEGDLITIVGSGFGNDPDDLCVVARFGDTAVPMRAVSVNDTEIVARVGTVPPGAPPAIINVMPGQGQVGFFEPAFEDIIVEEPAWTWEGDGRPGAMAPLPFEPIELNPPFGTQWFFAELVDGKLCTIINGDWGANTKIQVTARAHTATSQQDLDAPRTRFIGAGTPLECAARIKDIVVCAFEQQTGVIVEATCQELPDGSVKITICVPGEDIEWGLFTICAQECPPIIDGVNPPFGQEGDLITITGQGFGNDPDDLCVIAMDGARSIPLEAISASDEQVLAILGPIPPDAQPGPIMVGLGDGLRDFFVPAFPDIVVLEPVWVWNFGGFDAAGPFFKPIPTPPPSGTQWFFSDPPSGGVMCITISGTWQRGSKVWISGRLRDHATGRGYDQLARCIEFNGGADAFECALRICDVLTCAWSQLLGVNLVCTAEPIGPDEAKITLSFEDGSIDWGNISVCVQQPPGG